jgi:hypothetical protein
LKDHAPFGPEGLKYNVSITPFSGLGSFHP